MIRRALLASLLALLAACGSDEPSSSPEPAPDVTTVSDASAPDAAASDASPTACPSGHIVGPDGACMAVGIQGCDDMFIDPETGLCDPSLVDCPLGSIPIFGGEDQGCRPVGIQGCDDMFIDPETGMCDPAYLECPPGQIPIFSGEDQGCRAVGIVDCHPDFFDAETGRCDPQEDACPQGSMAIPTQGCVSLDPPGGCGQGTWGNIEELPGDVHLDVNYAGDDSDGSREKPWTLFSQAEQQVESGGRIVLAAGNYDEGFLISKSISVVGRCSSMVTCSGTHAGGAGPTTFEVGGPLEVEVSDVTISGGGRGIVAAGGAKLQVSRARIEQARRTAIIAFHEETEITVDTIWISGTQQAQPDQSSSAVAVHDGATVSVSRMLVSENVGIGLLVRDSGSSLSASDISVVGTRESSDVPGGHAVFAFDGGSVNLARALFVDNQRSALRISDIGTQLIASELSVMDTQLDSEGQSGIGLHILDGALAELSLVNISANHTVGLAAQGLETQVTASDLSVSVTMADGAGLYGNGIQVAAGASMSLTRARLFDNHETAILVGLPDTKLTASGVWVAGNPSAAQGQRGGRIQAQSGATVSLSRSLISNSETTGLAASGQGTLVSADELALMGTTVGLLAGGAGVGAVGGATLGLSRSWIANNYNIGVAAADAETSITVTESWISSTTLSSTGKAGYGLQVNDGSNMTLSRSRVSENHTAGLIAGGNGATLSAEAIWVDATRPRADGARGRGFQVQSGATCDISRSLVTANPDVGVMYFAAAGTVKDSLIDGVSPMPSDLGDGLLSTGSIVTGQGIVSRGHVRAGVLFDTSQGEFTTSLVEHNAIGVANQGLPGATIADDNRIEANDQDRLYDANLEVPDEPMELPELSDSGG